MSELSLVVKRDGRKEIFNAYKIKEAINKAFLACIKENDLNKNELDVNKLEKLFYNVIDNLKEKFTENKNPTVEEIQDEVERCLIKNNFSEIAKKYIIYRNERSKVRETKTSLMNTFKSLIFTDSKDNDDKRECANINGDTAQGLMGYIASEASRKFNLNFLIDKEISKAHIDGDIHIHDLDLYMMTSTCTQIDISKLFKNGFNTGHGTIREPKSIRTACSLTAIAIQANQNDQHGGQSIPALDYYLAPYISKSYTRYFKNNIKKYLRFFIEDIKDEIIDDIISVIDKTIELKDKEKYSDIVKEKIKEVFKNNELTEKEINKILKYSVKEALAQTEDETYQGCEALIHNLNTMNSRGGGQCPFSSINLGTDTSYEGRMLIKNFLLSQERGLGNGETSIFPISIFKVKEGINYNPEDPNYDLFKLAMRCSSKRMFPNFEFIDAPFNLQYYKKGDINTEIATMGATHKDSICTYKHKDKIFKVTFEDAWDYFKDYFEIEQKHTDISNWMELKDVEIYDSTAKKFVHCYRIIKNKIEDGLGIILENNTYLKITKDHPLQTLDKGRTLAEDIVVGDKIEVINDLVDKYNYKSTYFTKVISIKPIKFDDYVYDVTTATERFDLDNVCSWNCRTRVIGNVYDPTRQIVTGRGNLSFVTLNLPRIAIESNKDINKFYKLLDKRIDLCIKELLDRLEVQSKKKVFNFPFLMGQGIWLDSEKLKKTDEIGEVLKHGTLSVGFVGLAETLVALIGKHHGESEEAQKLGLEIIGYMRKRMDDESQKRNLNFTLLASPAESTCGTLLRKDVKKFGIIKGVTDKKYYTNSNHIPVYYKISAFDKIKKEAPYHALCNAGHICYVEIDGNIANNLDVFEKIIRCMKENNIGYGAINHPLDYDPVCGYNGVIDDICPKCGRKETAENPYSKIRRITGYLVGTLDLFNNGKKAEEQDRVKHI